jgi:hypothetical protein
MLNIYGNETMSTATPNIDQLAKESVTFDYAYAAAGSTPSRASFLTSRHALRGGMISGSRFGLSFLSPAQPGGLKFEEKTLPEMLKDDPAYGPTGHFGTWHLGYGNNGTGLPLNHGYDRFFGTPLQPSLKSCDNNLGTQNTVAEDKYGNKLNEDTPEARAAAAAAAAKAAASSQPFIGGGAREYGITWWALWSLTSIVWQSLIVLTIVSWFAGIMNRKHCGLILLLIISCGALPFFFFLDGLTVSNPKSCILLRNDEIVEQPVRMGTYVGRITSEAIHFIESSMVCSRHRCRERQSFALTISYPLPPPNSLNALFADDYTGNGKQADAIAEVDHNIGILMRKINHLGLRDRTLVVLTGFSPDYFTKEIGKAPMRVPMMVSLEGHVEENTRSAHPIDIMDIVPTFLQLAEIEPSVHLDGKSFWNVIVSFFFSFVIFHFFIFRFFIFSFFIFHIHFLLFIKRIFANLFASSPIYCSTNMQQRL